MLLNIDLKKRIIKMTNYFKGFLLTCICTSISSMEILKEMYHWPEKKPSVLQDSHSLFGNHKQMKRILSNDMRIIIELGSWLGASTRFILNNAPNATVIAIDHWKGSTEHQKDMAIYYSDVYAKRLKTLYETFLINCWTYKNRLIPLRATTLQGLQIIYNLGIVPDLVYVDASHDFDSVLKDLEKIYSCFPSTLIIGDDWEWDKMKNDHYPVRRAVKFFLKKYGFEVVFEKNFWMIVK